MGFSKEYPEHCTIIADIKNEKEFDFKISGGSMHINFSDIMFFLGIDEDYYFKKQDI